MAAVLFVSSDTSMMVQLLDGLEAVGLAVTWVGVAEGVPGKPAQPPEVVVLDGDSPGMNLVDAARAWKATDPAPAVVVVAQHPSAERAAASVGVPMHRKPLDSAALGPALVRAAEMRFVGALTPGAALHAVGARPSGDPMKDAFGLLAGSRHVDFALVRDALRPFADSYLTITPAIEALRERRALTVPEVNLALPLDGSRTLRTVAQNGVMDPQGALRLLWALASTGVLRVTSEPPDDAGHPAARLVAQTRRRLRARKDFVQRAQTHFDLLEVPPDPELAPAIVDAAARAYAVWFSPQRIGGLDLGDLGSVVEPYWQQVLKARELLVDASKCRRYVFWLIEQGMDLEATMRTWGMKHPEAEACFARGVQALAEAEAFRAVSQLAQASRLVPDEPDYEAYGAWARYMAELARGNDTRPTVVRELANIEKSLLGRRPRPRALYAMALLAQVAGDLVAARTHLQDALGCDPNMVVAQRALARLTYGKTPAPERS